MPGEHSAVLEPLGQRSSESKIERYWASVSSPHSLERQRVSVFDVEACMSMAPMRYVSQALEFHSNLPTDEWIAAGLLAFVRGEFPSRTARTQPHGDPKLTFQEVGAEFLQKFLAASEGIEPILKPGRESSDPRAMAASIYELLCDSRIGSTKNRVNNEREYFVENLVGTIERESRLLFVLPGFPFKDQNRFRVPYSAEEPDLADISFLIRLHRLTQALYQVHPFGADVLILSDGSLYADIFRVPMDAVDRYMRRLKAYRNQLNLQGTVSIIPLEDLLSRPDVNGVRPLDMVAEIEVRLRSLTSSASDLSEIFADLKAGMKRNINSKDLLSDLSSEDASTVVYSATAPAGPISSRWSEYDLISEDAAYRYAAVNLTLKWFDLIMLHFPGAIRGTVHPKIGQFALAGSGGAYAWNGVAVSNSWPQSIDDVKVSPFFTLGDHSSVVRVSFDDGLPAFFMPGSE